METPLLFNRIKDIYLRMARAAMKADRSPDEVQLIAVTKTVSVGAIREAVDCGLRIFGENRVQEAKRKVISEEMQSMSEVLAWHFIGHLQTNKAKDAVQLFDLIHAVDSRNWSMKSIVRRRGLGRSSGYSLRSSFPTKKQKTE